MVSCLICSLIQQHRSLVPVIQPLLPTENDQSKTQRYKFLLNNKKETLLESFLICVPLSPLVQGCKKSKRSTNTRIFSAVWASTCFLGFWSLNCLISNAVLTTAPWFDLAWWWFTYRHIGKLVSSESLQKGGLMLKLNRGRCWRKWKNWFKGKKTKKKNTIYAEGSAWIKRCVVPDRFLAKMQTKTTTQSLTVKAPSSLGMKGGFLRVCVAFFCWEKQCLFKCGCKNETSPESFTSDSSVKVQWVINKLPLI